MKFFPSLYRYRNLLGVILFFTLAIIFEKNIRTQINQEKEFTAPKAIIREKTKKVDAILESIELKMDSMTLKEIMLQRDFLHRNLYEKEGIVILGYTNDSLVFWSNNSIPVENYIVNNQLYSDVAKLKNGWFIIRQNYIDNTQLFGLILLKREYSYQNEFIKTSFFEAYNIDFPVSIVQNKEIGYPISDYKESYLFSFELKSNLVYDKTLIYLSVFIYFIAILFLFMGIRQILTNAKTNKIKYFYFSIFVLVLFGLRFLMFEYRFPDVFRQLELFQPHHFALSSFVPSLGDLLLHSIFIFVFFLIFKMDFKIDFPEIKVTKWFILIFSIIWSFFLFALIEYFFESLILHSSISFNVYQFFKLSIYSLVGFIIVVLLLGSFFLFVDKIVEIAKTQISLKNFLWVFIPLSLSLYFILGVFQYQLKLISFLFYVLLVINIAYVRIRKGKFTYPVIIFILLFFTLYTVAFITIVGQQKEKETKKVLAVNLANEHDQIAEMLLEGLEENLEKDTVIKDLLIWHHQNEGALLEHLQMNYFGGYFRKYDLNISVCDPSDDLTLILENSTEIVPCYSFFNNVFENDGVELQGSRFFFLDNLDGRIRYLGRFVFNSPDWKAEVSLFVSLDSKLVSQELGYPELLLDKKMSGSTILNDYSYAKYKKTDLITRSGAFSYQLIFPESWTGDKEFSFISDSNYDHLIYKIDNTTSIVISSTKLRFVDLLASFSYIFVFYYVLNTLVFFLLQFPDNIKGFNYDFKNKIKISMIGVLLLSLVIVGFGTIYYNINQFERNLYEGISEKIQSVKVEMEQKLGGEFELSEEYSDYLTYLLTKFSTVFNIDINLYDINGNLLASSRAQVFEKGLMGGKMNYEAFQEMVVANRGQYIHKESIGELSYYSAYVPLPNDANELLGYLNLPYFTKQSALKREIYTIVVAVVNIYFFLILISVIVAIFVSNNITRPLQLIQERFRAIDLGKQNEPIVYSSYDEIGSLIKEYNRMVSELSENTEKLAKSERESAWREMAKQIAHEIKNPLTPMKLSVQYLQKAWKDGTPDFDKRLEKFSNSLISQINNLSNIATEFSNFAKMPRTRAEQVNIIAKLTDSINLLENTENIKFVTHFPDQEELYVYADKEQLLIVFSNLIQNGMQAVPKDREGIISINVEEVNQFVKVTINDNGIGIPDDLKDKLFIPNFTTKSSGMGLGLAIVKNIVENANGEIGYQTELNKGTSFFVTFPLYNQSE